jgi:hypothetical protein
MPEDNAPATAEAEELKTIPFPPQEPGRPATDEEAAEAQPIEAESTAPTENEAPPEPPEPPKAVRIAQKARIQWFDENGEVEAEEECWRSLAAVFVHLAEIADQKERELTQKVRVYLVITDDDGNPSTMTNSKGEERSEVVLYDGGTLDEALNHFAQIAMPPQVAYAKLQGAIAQISEQSNLKTAIVMLVFDNSKPAGMVFTSDACDVTDDDLIMLGTSGEGFLDQYKAAMRKDKNIQFPGDSPIIVPGMGAGMPPPDLRG